MFGHRTDGYNVSNKIDPIVLFTPLIMPTRCESQNLITYPVEYEPIADYIRKKRQSGENMSFLDVICAAYVRTVKRCPYINYFVMGKRVYCHNDISISLTLLRENPDGTQAEDLIKVHATPDDTVQQIAEKFKIEIDKTRQTAGGTLDFASKLLRFPVLPSVVVGIVRLLDRLGLMPKWLVEISPFHCSMFITNVMSIGLPTIFHHLYNFGTNSEFIAMGKPERQLVVQGGKTIRKAMIPLGVVTDERICGGGEYAKAGHVFAQLLKNPALLEMTPDEEDAYLASLSEKSGEE